MYRRIYLLFGISIFGIVVSHATARGLWALYAWTDRYQILLPRNFDPFVTPQWFSLVLLQQIFAFGVSSFFFVSGYFISSYTVDISTGKIKWKIITTRVLGLLFPYVFWSIFKILQDSALYIIKKDIFLESVGQYYIPSFLSIVYIYWFVPVLILFYFVSPLIVNLARRNWKKLLIYSCFLQILFTISRYTWFVNIKNPIVQFILVDNFDKSTIYYLFIFSFGVVFGMYLPGFKNWLERHRILLLILCVLFLFITFYLGGWTKIIYEGKPAILNISLNVGSQIYSLLFLMTYLAFNTVKIPFSKYLEKLSRHTYGIYLTHLIFVGIFIQVVYNIFPLLLYYQLLITLFSIILGFGGPLLLIEAFKKLPRPIKGTYRYLFG